jgi:hypothetical protein
MQLRHNTGARPQITFTSDFHELVQGDLVPGPCLLRYDPLRLIELGDAADQTHLIRACVRFHPGGVEWQGVMALPPGLPVADLADPTGDGLMLTTSFEIPDGCDELEIWFSCTHADGHTHWDSDFGKNHWLRFGLADLALKTAKIVEDTTAAQDSFQLEIPTKPGVESLQVRWRVTSNPGFVRQVTPLIATATTSTGKTWTAPEGGVPVPKGATIAFDILYTVGGRVFTDDNQGRWYIAD